MYRSSFSIVLPHWQVRPACCELSFMKLDKNRVARAAILNHFQSLQFKYPRAEFYSDSSKIFTLASSAAHGTNFCAARTLSIRTTIFSAEGYRILLIVQHILENKIPNFVIYTDFMSVFRARSSERPPKNHIVKLIFNTNMSVYAQKHALLLC